MKWEGGEESENVEDERGGGGGGGGGFQPRTSAGSRGEPPWWF